MTHDVCPIENLFEQSFAFYQDDGPQGVAATGPVAPHARWKPRLHMVPAWFAPKRAGNDYTERHRNA